jgi:hypothetical protein
MAATITSATAVYLLSITGVFNTPVQLSGFSADEAFDTNAVDATVTQIGVDGTGVGGYVPRAVEQTISLLASSPSNAVFDQWIQAMDAALDTIYASGSIRLASLGVQYTMPFGVLKRYPIAPNARRVLMPRVFTIEWLPQRGSPAVTVSPI